MKEKREAVMSGEALSNLFLTLNHDRSTQQKMLQTSDPQHATLLYEVLE